jgi:starch synthase
VAAGMNIVMLAGEAEPYAKVGGLADVIGALPPQLEKLGASVSILIPRYGSIDLAAFRFQPHALRTELRVPLGADSVAFDVHAGTLPNSRVRVFLIGNDRFFGGAGIYADPATGLDFPNQAERWIFFQRAALEFARHSLGRVDVLHCHDHQAGLAPAYLRRSYGSHPGFHDTVSVFTIHNMGYQGLFPQETMARAGFSPGDFYAGGPFEFFGRMNFMKAGIVHADVVTTVSPTYAREIQESGEFGYGLEGVLRARANPPVGILNGIDYETWNPETDPLIPAKFGVQNLFRKVDNKRALLAAFGLRREQVNRPVLAMISRLDVQKGFDLAVPVVDDILSSSSVSFVLLGSGNEAIKAQLRTIAERHPGRANVRFGYNKELSHLIEAGADIFLMPSKYEPCGLNQMYSMRYGTVPVVRATGGLADTVQEFDPGSGAGTGFVFSAYDAAELAKAVRLALAVWKDQKAWQRAMTNGMTLDFSWGRSAKRYLEVYEDALRHKS